MISRQDLKCFSIFWWWLLHWSGVLVLMKFDMALKIFQVLQLIENVPTHLLNFKLLKVILKENDVLGSFLLCPVSIVWRWRSRLLPFSSSSCTNLVPLVGLNKFVCFNLYKTLSVHGKTYLWIYNDTLASHQFYIPAQKLSEYPAIEMQYKCVKRNECDGLSWAVFCLILARIIERQNLNKQSVICSGDSQSIVFGCFGPPSSKTLYRHFRLADNADLTKKGHIQSRCYGNGWWLKLSIYHASSASIRVWGISSVTLLGSSDPNLSLGIAKQ